MKEIFEIIFHVSMLAFVIGSMVTLGLGLTVSQLLEPFKNIKIVILALIVNFIIVPAFALGLVWLFPVSTGTRIGMILLALGGGAPFIPLVVATAKGYIAGAVSLMLLLLIVTIFFMPITVPILLPGTVVSSLAIAKSLVLMMVIPLALALAFKSRYPQLANMIKPFSAKFTNLNILILVIAVIFLYTKIMIANVSVLPIILLFFVGSSLMGYFAGGKKRNARIILTVGTGLRNPTVAILVASQNFSHEPMASIIPLIITIIGLSILFPLAKKIAK